VAITRDLAREAAGLDIAGVRLAAGNAHTREGPASWEEKVNNQHGAHEKLLVKLRRTARARAAENVVVLGAAGDGAGNLVELEVLDGDAVRGLAGGRAVLVVLLDVNAVLGDVGELDVRVGDVRDRAGRAIDSLDAHAVLGVEHLRVDEGDVLHDVIAAAANGADGEAMATITVQVREVKVGTRAK
jgi:hypothetical protein